MNPTRYHLASFEIGHSNPYAIRDHVFPYLFRVDASWKRPVIEAIANEVLAPDGRCFIWSVGTYRHGTHDLIGTDHHEVYVKDIDHLRELMKRLKGNLIDGPYGKTREEALAAARNDKDRKEAVKYYDKIQKLLDPK